jgi:hypothetical protein
MTHLAPSGLRGIPFQWCGLGRHKPHHWNGMPQSACANVAGNKASQLAKKGRRAEMERYNSSLNFAHLGFAQR